MRLSERYRQVYEGLHAQRDRVAAEACVALEAAGASTQAFLRTYPACSGLVWADDGLKCKQCDSSLQVLYLQTSAIPAEAKRLADRAEALRDAEARHREESSG